MNSNKRFVNYQSETHASLATFALSTKLKPKNTDFMKKKIFTIAVGSIAFIAATMCVSIGVNAQIINTIAGTGSPSYGGDGAAATLAQISDPTSVKVDAAGNIYIVDRGNECIRKVNTAGTISTIAGTAGSSGYSGDGGAATAAQINSPSSVAVDGSGNIYITDYGNNRIRKVDASGIITTIAGGTTSGSTGDGGPATDALLNRPQGINVDAAGNVFFVDEQNHAVRKITVSTGIISRVAGIGTSGSGGDGGSATAANMLFPKDVVVDPMGNVFIADYGNHRIRKVNTSGIISTIAGGATSGSTTGGYAVDALINHPYAVALDNQGNLLFNDQGNNFIRIIFTSGIMTAIVGNGFYGFTGDGGNPGTAKISTIGIAADTSGNTYLAEYGYHRIRKVTASGITLSGTKSICLGNPSTLTASLSGGTWGSYDTTIATVDASGVVTGLTAGIATLFYFTSSGGSATVNVSVNPAPAAIAGTTTVCIAATTTLTNATAGGTWSSSNGAIATIDAAGTYTGIAAGSAVMTYTIAGGCYATQAIDVISCPINVKSEPETSATISLYPNPSSGTINISLPENGSVATITVSDMYGRVLETFEAAKVRNFQHSMTGVPAGNYIIQIATGKEVYRKKLTVVN
jgi:hypothetical protein